MKYESPVTHNSKDMANVKVFAERQNNRQTNRQTDIQAIYYMPPIFRYGGIKNDTGSLYFSTTYTEKNDPKVINSTEKGATFFPWNIDRWGVTSLRRKMTRVNILRESFLSVTPALYPPLVLKNPIPSIVIHQQRVYKYIILGDGFYNYTFKPNKYM
jgi:hypothetical protein